MEQTQQFVALANRADKSAWPFGIMSSDIEFKELKISGKKIRGSELEAIRRDSTGLILAGMLRPFDHNSEKNGKRLFHLLNQETYSFCLDENSEVLRSKDREQVSFILRIGQDKNVEIIYSIKPSCIFIPRQSFPEQVLEFTLNALRPLLSGLKRR